MSSGSTSVHTLLRITNGGVIQHDDDNNATAIAVLEALADIERASSGSSGADDETDVLMTIGEHEADLVAAISTILDGIIDDRVSAVARQAVRTAATLIDAAERHPLLLPGLPILLPRRLVRSHMRTLNHFLQTDRQQQSLSLVIDGLRLLVACARSSPLTARELCNSFDFANHTLQRHLRPTPAAASAWRKATKAGATAPALSPACQLHRLAIDFAFAFLEHRDAELTVHVLGIANFLVPSLVQPIALRAEPTQVRLCIRRITRDLLLCPRLSRGIKLRLCNPSALSAIAQLYSADTVSLPADAIHDFDDAPPSVPRPPLITVQQEEGTDATTDSDVDMDMNTTTTMQVVSLRDYIHSFLLLACTAPDAGICFAVREPLASDVESANPVLQRFLTQLPRTVADDSLLTTLVLSILRTCPDLVRPYFVSAAQSLEPRLSTRWLTSVQFAARILRDCVVRSARYGPSLRPESLTAVDGVACAQACVTLNATLSAWLARALRHSSDLIVFYGLQLVDAMLTAARRMIEGQLTDAYLDAFRTELALLLPDVGAVVALNARLFAPDKRDTASRFAQSALLRVLAGYALCAPHALREARFDLSKLMPTPALLARWSPVLQRDLFRLMHAATRNRHLIATPSSTAVQSQQIVTMVALWCSHTLHPDVRAQLSLLFTAWLEHTEIFDAFPDEIAVWLAACRARPSLASFLTAALVTCNRNFVHWHTTRASALHSSRDDSSSSSSSPSSHLPTGLLFLCAFKTLEINAKTASATQSRLVRTFLCDIAYRLLLLQSPASLASFIALLSSTPTSSEVCAPLLRLTCAWSLCNTTSTTHQAMDTSSDGSKNNDSNSDANTDDDDNDDVPEAERLLHQYGADNVTQLTRTSSPETLDRLVRVSLMAQPSLLEALGARIASLSPSTLLLACCTVADLASESVSQALESSLSRVSESEAVESARILLLFLSRFQSVQPSVAVTTPKKEKKDKKKKRSSNEAQTVDTDTDETDRVIVRLLDLLAVCLRRAHDPAFVASAMEHAALLAPFARRMSHTDATCRLVVSFAVGRMGAAVPSWAQAFGHKACTTVADALLASESPPLAAVHAVSLIHAVCSSDDLSTLVSALLNAPSVNVSSNDGLFAGDAPLGKLLEHAVGLPTVALSQSAFQRLLALSQDWPSTRLLEAASAILDRSSHLAWSTVAAGDYALAVDRDCLLAWLSPTASDVVRTCAAAAIRLSADHRDTFARALVIDPSTTTLRLTLPAHQRALHAYFASAIANDTDIQQVADFVLMQKASLDLAPALLSLVVSHARRETLLTSSPHFNWDDLMERAQSPGWTAADEAVALASVRASHCHKMCLVNGLLRSCQALTSCHSGDAVSETLLAAFTSLQQAIADLTTDEELSSSSSSSSSEVVRLDSAACCALLRLVLAVPWLGEVAVTVSALVCLPGVPKRQFAEEWAGLMVANGAWSTAIRSTRNAHCVRMFYELCRVDNKIAARSLLPTLMYAYTPTLALFDRATLALVRLFEECGVHVVDAVCLCGAEAHERLVALLERNPEGHVEIGIATSRSSDVVIVEALDAEKLYASADQLPTDKVQLEPSMEAIFDNNVTVETGGEDTETLYDPSYLLPVIARALTNGVDVHRLIHDGVLAYLPACVTCEDAAVRAASFHVLTELEETVSHIETMREQAQVLLVLKTLRQGCAEAAAQLDDEGQVLTRVPTVIGTFVGHALRVLLQPGHRLFPALNSALLRAPALDLAEIPSLHSLLQSSSSETHSAERQWLLRVLAASLRHPDDVLPLRRRRLLPHLMTFADSPLVDRISRELSMTVIQRACKHQACAADLARHHGAIAWLCGRVHHSDAFEPTLSALDALASTLLPGARIERLIAELASACRSVVNARIAVHQNGVRGDTDAKVVHLIETVFTTVRSVEAAGTTRSVSVAREADQLGPSVTSLRLLTQVLAFKQRPALARVLRLLRPTIQYDSDSTATSVLEDTVALLDWLPSSAFASGATLAHLFHYTTSCAAFAQHIVAPHNSNASNSNSSSSSRLLLLVRALHTCVLASDSPTSLTMAALTVWSLVRALPSSSDAVTPEVATLLKQLPHPSLVHTHAASVAPETSRALLKAARLFFVQSL